LSAVDFSRFVAIGDSQTEGVGDLPNPDGSNRGWADRFAARLADSNPGLHYANLAIRGRRVAQVYQEQFGPALRMEPDLVSVIAGMNDLIRPGFDMDFTLELMNEMESAFVSRGATVVTITYPDPDGLGPIGRLLEDRIRDFNQGIRDVAAANGTRLLDLEPIKATSDSRIWQPDRLHLNPDGHWRMAMGMVSLVAPDLADPAWEEPLPPRVEQGPGRTFSGEAEWALRYLLPWVGRRLAGRSSGDGIHAKRPRLEPLAAFSQAEPEAK
jgi:lysophospholipase L1-like esterase